MFTAFQIQSSVATVSALVEELNTISGQKPNNDKCIVLQIGSLKGTNFELLLHPIFFLIKSYKWLTEN